MKVGSAMMGVLAMAVPTVFVVFGLVMAVIVGWRNWFGLGTKDKDDESN